MNCPWCDFEAGPRGLHAHLAEHHPGAVGAGERRGKAFYEITCPLCGARYEHAVKKGARDPRFVQEFEREIAMVALDMLVNHLLAEHEHEDAPSGRPRGE